MTAAEIQRLAALAREATPGPWTPWLGTGVRSNEVVDIAECDTAEIEEDGDELTFTQCEANAAYIAAANPAAVLALIERARELEADAARFRYLIANAEHFPDPEPRPDAPISWGWSVQWGCWTHQGADIRLAIDATMKEGD